MTALETCEPAYDEGRTAFLRGDSDSLCPYKCKGDGFNNERMRWMQGYHSERVQQIIDAWDAKYLAAKGKA